MTRRPILMVKNAGFGETPVPKDALFQPGEVITAARKDNPDIPVEVTCRAVVPKGCCIDYALADQSDPKEPRPLVISNRKAYSETVYVLQFMDDPEPRIYTQTEMETGREEAEVLPITAQPLNPLGK
jgi:hypothetical protein